MGKLVVTYNIPSDNKIRIGYRQAGTTVPFTYLSSYLTSSQSPYTIEVADGSYEVEFTTATASCKDNPCGTPIVIKANTIDTNTITADIIISTDSNNHIYFSIEFSEIITSSITVSGTYVTNNTSFNYSVTVPGNVLSYNTILDNGNTEIDEYCYSSISPSILNNKSIVATNITQC